VEAVTLADDPRVVGVQWELQVSWVEARRFLRVFADLVAAARGISAAACDGSQRVA
jgi:gamma-glutamyl-gamma-aminobutyrate hydrolase PuuD